MYYLLFLNNICLIVYGLIVIHCCFNVVLSILDYFDYTSIFFYNYSITPWLIIFECN